MVCAPTEKASRIDGGFVLLNVAGLMTAWRACRARPLGMGDFRCWLACHEAGARRRVVERGRAPAYGLAELAWLLGVAEKRARASVSRLVAAGLVEWSDSAIVFPDLLILNDEQLADSIGGGRGSLAVPRRMLRLLARGARPALIATTLGVLLRCLSRRRGGFDGRGRVKASWIARVFEVDLRRVKAARRELVALRWITPEPPDQRGMNRWGRAYRIDLAWNQIEPGGRSLPPPPTVDQPAIATPSVDQEPLPEREEDQEPAGGPPGFPIEGPGGRDEQPTVRTNSGPAGMTSVSGLPPAPKLDDVRIEDLEDTVRTLELLGQAVDRKLIGASEAERLKFVAAAEHAMAIGKGNRPGLFAYLVRNGRWRFITQADEDAARRRLRLHDFGPPRVSIVPTPFSSSSSRPIEPGLPEDARIVEAVRGASIRAGIFRDPWPAFQARYPGWDRGRWDAALAELGTGR